MKFLSIEDMLELDKQTNSTNYRDVEVDLKVGKDRDSITKIVRLIGFATQFERFSPFKKDADGERVDAKWHDREGNNEGYKENKKFYRIGTMDDEEYGACPWRAGGWEKSTRLAQNCLERHKDGTFSVKILTGPKMLFDEFTKVQKLNQQRNEEIGKKKYPTVFGGATSYDFRVLAEIDKSKKGMKNMPKYTVSNEPDLIKITDEEIAALEAVGKPTPAQLEAIYESNEFLRDFPEWVLYGYDLRRHFRPDLLIKGDGSSSNEPPARVSVAVGGISEAPARGKATTTVDEWADEPATPPATTKPARTKPTTVAAPVAEEVVVDDDNVFEEEEDLGF